jgi:hypothetical protein
MKRQRLGNWHDLDASLSDVFEPLSNQRPRHRRAPVTGGQPCTSALLVRTRAPAGWPRQCIAEAPQQTSQLDQAPWQAVEKQTAGRGHGWRRGGASAQALDSL